MNTMELDLAAHQLAETVERWLRRTDHAGHDGWSHDAHTGTVVCSCGTTLLVTHGGTS